MDKIKVIEATQIDGTSVEMVEIDLADGGLLSMTKAHWDELEAAKEASGTL